MTPTNKFRWFKVPDNSIHCGTLCLQSTDGKFLVLQQGWIVEEPIEGLANTAKFVGLWRDVPIEEEK